MEFTSQWQLLFFFAPVLRVRVLTRRKKSPLVTLLNSSSLQERILVDALKRIGAFNIINDLVKYITLNGNMLLNIVFPKGETNLLV